METNFLIIGAVAIVAVLLIVFLIRRNAKDKQDLEVFLNENESGLEQEETDLNDNL